MIQLKSTPVPYLLFILFLNCWSWSDSLNEVISIVICLGVNVMKLKVICTLWVTFFASISLSSVMADDSVEPDVTAEGDAITAKHRYVLGDNDSKSDATRICFLEAKRKAIEYAGVYVVSTLEISQTEKFREARSDVKSLASALVSAELVTSNTGFVSGKVFVDCVAKVKVDRTKLNQDAAQKLVNKPPDAEIDSFVDRASEGLLFEDVSAGKVQGAKGWLELGMNPNLVNETGWTPLHIASHNGQVDMVQLLLKHGAEVNSINQNGDTSLLLAVIRQHKDVAIVLLSRGAKPNIHNEKYSPLLSAIGNQDLDMVRLLIKHGARVNDSSEVLETPLILSTKVGTTEITKFLLSSGADIYMTDKKNGATALHPAAFNGNLSTVKLLLSKGADINRRDSNKVTPLFAAAIGRHQEVVRILLEKGADPNATNKDGLTPLDVATLNDDQEISSMLYAKGARRTLAK